MKKVIMYAAVAAFAVSSFLTSCQSNESKVEEAQEELKEAKAELNAEYPAFKTNAEVQIADNEKRIAELRVKLNKPGTSVFDDSRKKKIDELEVKNAELRIKLEAYEKENSDWETFKREFNHDMEGIADAFKDLGNDNK